MQVINISTPLSYNGQHYDGVTVHNGVNMGEKSFPCNEDRKAIDFQNCAQDTSLLFVDWRFSALEVSDDANPHYLQLTAAE